MGTYHRRGHYRRGRDGRHHWVSGHEVTRNAGKGRNYRANQMHGASYISVEQRISTWAEELSIVEFPTKTQRPNSVCPVCGMKVWFFRNRRGGCAYFDAVGKPWPLHPCLNLEQSGRRQGNVTGLAERNAIDRDDHEKQAAPGIHNRRNNFISEHYSHSQNFSDSILVESIRMKSSPWDSVEYQHTSSDGSGSCCILIAVLISCALIGLISGLLR